MFYRVTRSSIIPLAALLLTILATGRLQAAVGGKLASNNSRAIALYEEGLKLAGQDKFAEAIEQLKQAILADSNFIQAHLRYMDAFKGQGRGDEVESIYRNKVTENPGNPIYHYLLGRALSDMAAKRAEFQKALQCDTTFYWAPYGIGGSYYIEGRFDEAVVYLNRALRMNPKMVDAVRLLGEVYLDKEMHLQARDQFEQAIQLDPGDMANYILLGQAYSRMDRIEKRGESFLFSRPDSASEPAALVFSRIAL